MTPPNPDPVPTQIPLPAPRCRGTTQRNLQCRNPAKYPVTNSDDRSLFNRCQLHVDQTTDFNNRLAEGEVEGVVALLANATLGNAEDIDVLVKQGNLTNEEVVRARKENERLRRRLGKMEALFVSGDTMRKEGVDVCGEDGVGVGVLEDTTVRREGTGRTTAAEFGMEGMVKNGPLGPTGPALMLGDLPAVGTTTTKYTASCAPTKRVSFSTLTTTKHMLSRNAHRPDKPTSPHVENTTLAPTSNNPASSTSSPSRRILPTRGAKAKAPQTHNSDTNTKLN